MQEAGVRYGQFQKYCWQPLSDIHFVNDTLKNKLPNPLRAGACNVVYTVEMLTTLFSKTFDNHVLY